jgi:hypothetical protein
MKHYEYKGTNKKKDIEDFLVSIFPKFSKLNCLEQQKTVVVPISVDISWYRIYQQIDKPVWITVSIEKKQGDKIDLVLKYGGKQFDVTKYNDIANSSFLYGKGQLQFKHADEEGLLDKFEYTYLNGENIVYLGMELESDDTGINRSEATLFIYDAADIDYVQAWFLDSLDRIGVVEDTTHAYEYGDIFNELVFNVLHHSFIKEQPFEFELDVDDKSGGYGYKTTAYLHIKMPLYYRIDESYMDIASVEYRTDTYRQIKVVYEFENDL